MSGRAWSEERRAEIAKHHRAALQRAACEHGGPITMAHWDSCNYWPKAHTVRARFGSWGAAWNSVGADWTPKMAQHLRAVTPERAIAALRDAWGGLRYAPGAGAWTAERRRPCAGAIIRALGVSSWAEACAAAGLRYLRYRHAEGMAGLQAVADAPAAAGVSDRAREMARRLLAGEALAVVGSDYDLTRERVRQIVEKATLRALRYEATRREASN